MDNHSGRIKSNVLNAFEHYLVNQLDLPELQKVVEAALDAIDNSVPKLMNSLKWLSAELESIRFMWPEQEQKKEVKKRINQVRTELC